ncbi:MAG: fibronectin type III domain-containing protein [bacterium]|nr:fibronectin type III domain-containing protein [bacterium]
MSESDSELKPSLKGMAIKKILTKALFITLLVGSMAACGKKGPPLPPESLVPAQVSGFKAEGRGEALLLSWTIPGKNNDGSSLNDLAGFKLYQKKSGEGCNSCPSEFPVYADIDIEAPGHAGKAAIEGKRLIFTVRNMEPGLSYSFKVAPYNKSGYFGEFSEVITLNWDLPPAPPSGLKGLSGNRSVTLSWHPSTDKDKEGFAGYLVYRADAPGAYSKSPRNAAIIETESYTDLGLENDRPYYYVVKSATKQGQTVAEGEPSEEIAIAAKDKVPPLPPEGLSVVPTKAGVRIFWDSSEEMGLFGYNIYRREKGAGAAIKLNDAPLVETHYTDADAGGGKIYYYFITALDGAATGNESEATDEVYTIVPDFNDLTN